MKDCTIAQIYFVAFYLAEKITTMMHLSDSKLPKLSSWCPPKDIIRRSLGLESNTKFRDKANASKPLVERLELKMKLDFHNGCVNSLNFNEEGDLIASGSDDCNVAIWNWTKNSKEPQLWYDSGHNSNVFQVYYVATSIDKLLLVKDEDFSAQVLTWQ